MDADIWALENKKATLYANVSHVDENYRPINKVVRMEI